MPVSHELKEATADAHRHAESRELQRLLIGGKLDAERLAVYLGQLHRVHQALETYFDQHADVAAIVTWTDDFRHSERLQLDLTELGPDEIALVTETELLLQDMETIIGEYPPALLGLFYVLEGSMNGNRFIVRALKHGPLAGRCSFRYFDPYGDDQAARWNAFKTSLDVPDFDAEQQRVIVLAARRMFDAIARISDEVMSTEPERAAAGA